MSDPSQIFATPATGDPRDPPRPPTLAPELAPELADGVGVPPSPGPAGQTPGDWRFYLAAALAGCLAGLVGAAFHAILDLAEQGRTLLGPAVADWPVPVWLVYMCLGSATLTLALWLVRRFAPETAGSGIQEVEAILGGERTLRWHRVLPVKFAAGALAVGSGLVLGREGPTVHMGSALGCMAGGLARLGEPQIRSLIAAGAGAGLAAAFNAPLAAIVFVTEELREHFEYSFRSLQSVILACCLSVLVCEWLLGQGPALPIAHLATPELTAAPLFLLLGALIGGFGALFNRLLLGAAKGFAQLRQDLGYGVPLVAGALLGALVWLAPAATGGGESLVESLLAGHLGLCALLLLLAIRTLTSVGSYGLGLPGGIFAPMLALGTIAGAAFDLGVDALAPGLGVADGVFALAAMGALFAATVRAPLTGIVLAIELTGAQGLALPIVLTCLAATFAAEALGGRPIYSDLLALSRTGPPRAGRYRAGPPVGVLVLAVLLAMDWAAPDRGAMERGTIDAGANGREAEVAGQTTGDARPVRGPVVAPAPSGRGAAAGAPPAPLDPGTGETGAPIGARGSAALPAGPWLSRAPQPIGSAPRPSGSESPEPPKPPDPPVPSAGPAPDPGSAAPTAESATPRSGSPGPAPGDSDRAAVPPTGYAIQLISFRSRASVDPFARRHGLEGRIRVERARHRGTDWHLVLLGDYPTRAQALDALQRLPDDLTRLAPRVREIAPPARPPAP